MIVLPPEGAARQVGEYTVEAFVELSPEGATRVFDTKTYLTAFDSLLKKPDDDIAVDLLNQSLVVNCLDAQVSHLLVLALSPITLFALQLLRRQGVKTVHWFYEDYRRALYWRDVLPGYDYFLAVQKNAVEQECQNRGVHYSFVPTAATPHLSAIDSGAEKKWNCAFIGIPSPYRILLLEQLHAAGISLIISGMGWNTYNGPLKSSILERDWIEPEESRQLYNQSSIGLNISNNDPDGDRINPQVSPRVYDVLSTSAKLVVEEVALLKETLSEFSYYPFETVPQLIELIQREVQSAQSPEVTQLHQNNLMERHQYVDRVKLIVEITQG